MIYENNWKNIFYFLVFLFYSCTKEKLPVSSKVSIQGTYVFNSVNASVVDNSVSKSNAYYDSGAIFINPYDVKGIDTIITNFSLMKIKNNKVFFDAEIMKGDTIWNVSYDCSYNDLYTFKGTLLTFYPQGTKRDWEVETANGKEFVIIPPLVWPNSNNGPAYSFVFKLKKI
jgi:hypothetical protein